MSHTIEITGYLVGARVQFVETDIDRVINIGETGVVVESFAPNTGRNVQLADGRIVNVPTYYLQDVEPALVDISDLINLSQVPGQDLASDYQVFAPNGFPIVSRSHIQDLPQYSFTNPRSEWVILVDRGERYITGDRYVVATWVFGDYCWTGGDYHSSLHGAVNAYEARRLLEESRVRVWKLPSQS